MTTAQKQARSRELFFEGIDHFEAQRLEQARECFERCLALTPGRSCRSDASRMAMVNASPETTSSAGGIELSQT